MPKSVKASFDKKKCPDDPKVRERTPGCRVTDSKETFNPTPPPVPGRPIPTFPDFPGIPFIPGYNPTENDNKFTRHENVIAHTLVPSKFTKNMKLFKSRTVPNREDISFQSKMVEIAYDLRKEYDRRLKVILGWSQVGMRAESVRVGTRQLNIMSG